MDIDHPDINSNDLATEVRKAITRHAKLAPAQTLSSTTSRTKNPDPNSASSIQVTSVSHADSDPSSTESQSSQRFSFPSLQLQPDFVPRSDDNYHVRDLLMFHDATFIRAAYQAILKRDPDAEDYLHHLEYLRSGEFDKLDVLASLCRSMEAKLKNVTVRGLTFPTLIKRIGRLPLLGYPIRVATALFRLPKMIRHLRQLHAHLVVQDEKLANHFNVMNGVLANHLSNLSDRVEEFVVEQQRQSGALLRSREELLAELRNVADQLDTQSREVEKQSEQQRREFNSAMTTLQELAKTHDEIETLINQRLQQANQRIENLSQQLQQARAELALQGRRTAMMFEDAPDKRLHAEQQPAMGMSPGLPNSLDAVYAGLEDRFRGSPEAIKSRLTYYLTYLKASLLSQDLPIVDLGCGRGEWLELLKEEGFKAVGCDVNKIFLERCRERDLEVIESDALVYLGGLRDNSVKAITGFHIIEHLELAALLRLLDEIVRVLHPGGLVIFETPNPENVLVGSNYFYFDPTHRNPLPSPLMEYLFETRGLHRIEVINLNSPEVARPEGSDSLTIRFNQLFYGPMDYAIAGWKL